MQYFSGIFFRIDFLQVFYEYEYEIGISLLIG